ncbi:hypothetical protein [Nostoc sp.]
MNRRYSETGERDRSPKWDVTVVVSYDYSLQMFVKIQHPNGW